MINPPDALVAARSFPRRWRTLFAEASDGDDHFAVLDRSGAPDLALEATAVMDETADRLSGARATTGTDGQVLDRLEAAADRLAEVIDRVPPNDWVGARIEALTAGIDRAATLLRQAEAAIEEARADRGG